jgi:hypothetical protein
MKAGSERLQADETSTARGTLRRGRGLAITLELDRQAAEALRWELRKLARRYGTDVAHFRVETVKREEEPSM